jgi:hypothetical protein
VLDFSSLNALRHRNRQEPHTGPASTPAPASSAAKDAIYHRLLHKGVGVAVAAVAGAVDAGGFWKGGMPAIGSKGTDAGLDIVLGTAGSIFELFSLWRGMRLGYFAPVVSGASDGLLFYWSGKQGQLWGASKRASTAGVAGVDTGFDYALPQGGHRPAPPGASQYVYDPLHGFGAQ